MQPFQPTGGDDTAALQAALAGSLSVEILAGNSLVSTPVDLGGSELIFRKGACLRATHPTNAAINMNAAGGRLISPRIEAAVTRTGGPFIRVPQTGIRTRIEDAFLLGAHWGVETDATIFDIDTIEIRDTVPGGVGIVINQGFDQSIRHMVMDAPANCAAGIWVNATGDLVLGDINIMHAGYCLALCPGNGQVVGNVRASNIFLDSSNIGFLANPGAGGHIIWTRIVNAWCGNHAYNAALVAGAGTIGDGGIEFTATDFVQSGTNGVTVTNTSAKAAKNIKAFERPGAVCYV